MAIDFLTIVGAGGHARVVYDAVIEAGVASRVEIRDDDAGLAGVELLGAIVQVPIGPAQHLARAIHIAIGNNATRARLTALLEGEGRELTTIVHPRAVISSRAALSKGSFVAALAVLAPGATVGKCAIINHGAIIDHDCVLGAWVHVAPNATVGGGVEIGEGTLIGAGATVLPGVSIGKWAIVGAGAVVIDKVPDGKTVVGVPARISCHA